MLGMKKEFELLSDLASWLPRDNFSLRYFIVSNFGLSKSWAMVTCWYSPGDLVANEFDVESVLKRINAKRSVLRASII